MCITGDNLARRRMSAMGRKRALSPVFAPKPRGKAASVAEARLERDGSLSVIKR